MKNMKRALPLILCLALLIGLVPGGLLSHTANAAVNNNATLTGETTYVLAGSDFQARGGHSAGAQTVRNILNVIQPDYPTMDGFLFTGDYDVDYTDSAGGKAALQSAVQSVYGTGMNEVYVQGNHDGDGLVGSTLSASGAQDTNAYGVFVINEKDYMWANDDEATIQNTADNLKNYLDGKRNAEYTKPIFVVSHLPLHYSMRTRQERGDGKYANYIFDVLNEAGAAGLNIVFLFGHNHSHGWDDYLGGAAIYLAKGDKINIAQSSTTVFEEETLNFTYMNAGYVGYYGDSYGGTADKTLTMTVFEINDTQVTISRYDQNGTHDLKSAGVYNLEHPDEDYYTADTTVVGTPKTTTLSTEITPTGGEIDAPGTGGSTTGRTYTLVTGEAELVSGDQYLLIYNGTKFVLPEIVTKSNDSGSQRTGMNLEDTSVASGGPATITGQYQAKEWQLVSSSGSWLLSNGTQQIVLTRTSNQGITATFADTGSAFSLNFNTSHLVSFTYGSWELNYNSRGLINGYDSGSDAARMYIYRLTDAGSDAPTVETENKGWVQITPPTSGTTNYIYKLDTDGVNVGTKYLIVNTASDGTAYALTNNNGTVAKTQVTVRDGQIVVEDDTNINWVFSSASKGTVVNQNRYLYPNENSLTLETSDSNLTISLQGSGAYRISRKSYYVRYTNKKWTTSTKASSSNIYLFVYDSSETSGATPGVYASIEGELSYEVAVGTTKDDALAAVKAGITGKTSADANGAEPTVELDDSALDWTLDSAYDGVTPGEYAVTISYRGKTLGIAKVVVPSVSVKDYTVDPMTGSVMKGVSQSKETGAYIVVTLENGDYYRVPVTVYMLTKADGSAVSTGEEGIYENLTVAYNGRVITENFTLNVTSKNGNNYPEYPNEGAVKVNKTGTGIDFQSTGVAQVEISASGVPVEKGADVIVMLDLSSSMNNTVGNQTRLAVLKESLRSMLEQLQDSGADIRIAVADFHRYYTDSSSPYYINSADHLAGGSIRTNADGSNAVYTGSGNLNADAFVDVKKLATTAFDTIGTGSGTNYDYAFDAVYQLGAAITERNATNGEARDLFVVFMSDGAPFQFNYFSSQSDGDGAAYWNNWLTGTLTDAMKDANARNDYYNEAGKHWMAEAIKGDPASTYPVIRKNNAADTDGDTWVDVNGLGATMFSIGFCLAVDKEITVDTMDTVIRNIASDETHYFRADSASDLDTAFGQIGNAIAYAATNARFVDQIGKNFSLQMKPIVDDRGEPYPSAADQMKPEIEIISYDIYQASEVGTTVDDVLVTADMVGNRKGTYTVLETVTFSDDGTKAYSDQTGENVNILADGSKAGFVKGVIYAKYFIYNTNANDVAVEGVSIPTATKADGTTTGSTNVLPSETFYWKMGTVQTSEMAMRYYVYLEGSMEGTRKAGAYPTNEFAILFYDNYLGNPCRKNTVSPMMPWKEANISYAFYLVNSEGGIIVNQTTGKTGSFAHKIAVTNPVVFQTIPLNSNGDVNAEVVAQNALPEGYSLYDSSAAYRVTIRSSEGGGAWSITKGTEPATTYVTEFGGTPNYSNATDVIDSRDYTHTVVWFAVVWEVQALPDTVVIDYGLPVDISVLANDMFGENGTLTAVGDYSDSLNLSGFDSALAAGFDASWQGTYGTAVADSDTGKVRYTLSGMKMDSIEKFAYAVHYHGAVNPGYYYDTVTVIPATTIYFEESFVSLESYTWANNGWTKVDGDGVWSQEGTAAGVTQDEDRPGKHSLTDANNIYGYDRVNADMSTFSTGSAMKAAVDFDNYGLASFTFHGTGFDVISMTSNTTGTIYVDVYQNDKLLTDKSFIVDTYYGYHQVSGDADGNGTIDEGECVWQVDPNASGSIYQVPVIKVEGLEYGEYTVKISAFYISDLDHVEGSTGYDFYLDAIRIYDPANDGKSNPVIENAYVADGEGWPSYMELRNHLIDAGTLRSSETVEGLVFIDGNAALGDLKLTEYKNYGPNNEVYLAEGQSVAFMLNLPENIAGVHLGIKSADGKPVSYTIYNIASAADGGTAKVYGTKTYTLNTATDMYYDITGYRGDVIVITNDSATYGQNGILSLTNLKFTFTSDPGAAQSEPEPFAFVYMTAPAAVMTLRTMNAMYLPEVFAPEDLQVSVNRDQVRQGDKVKLTVTASEDVAYITVNGEKITDYRIDRRTGMRVFTTTVIARDVGEMIVEVVAYDAGDVASEPWKTTVDVTEKKNLRKILNSLLNLIFG